MQHIEQIEALTDSLKTLLTDISITPCEVNADWLRERLIDTVAAMTVMAAQLHAVMLEVENVKVAAFQANGMRPD
jgi:hypothetical protein